MSTDSTGDLDQLHEIRRRLEAAENDGDPGYIGDMMAADAVLMVPSFPVQEGKAACSRFIHDILPNLLRKYDRKIRYVSAEVRVIGDIAYDRGTFRFTAAPRAGSGVTVATGKYFWLYSYSGDGSWRIARFIASLDEEEDASRARVSPLRAALLYLSRQLRVGH